MTRVDMFAITIASCIYQAAKQGMILLQVKNILLGGTRIFGERNLIFK